MPAAAASNNSASFLLCGAPLRRMNDTQAEEERGGREGERGRERGRERERERERGRVRENGHAIHTTKSRKQRKLEERTKRENTHTDRQEISSFQKSAPGKARTPGGEVWCGDVWCGVVWCGVVWCGVVWCGVVWCGVV